MSRAAEAVHARVESVPGARLQQRVQVAPAGGQAQGVKVVRLELCVLPGAPVWHRAIRRKMSTGPLIQLVKGASIHVRMHAVGVHATHFCSISAVRSVAAFFFSSANLGPLARRYVFQASGTASLRFLSASASALSTA